MRYSKQKPYSFMVKVSLSSLYKVRFYEINVHQQALGIMRILCKSLTDCGLIEILYERFYLSFVNSLLIGLHFRHNLMCNQFTCCLRALYAVSDCMLIASS
jgi:hypothetical protein